MSHSKHHYLALVPLLSLLAMSPAKFETKTISRSLASVSEKEAEKPFPKYEEVAGKIDRSSIEASSQISRMDFDKKVISLKEKLKEEKKLLESEVKDPQVLEKHKASMEKIVAGVIQLEEDAKAIKDLDIDPSFPAPMLEGRILDLKATVEDVLVASEKKLEEPKKEEVAVTDVKKDEAPAKEEPKKEEIAKDEKKEEVKPSENPEICELQEQNKLLSKQVEELLADQKKISESLVNITSTLAQLVQRQMNPWANYTSGPMQALSMTPQYPVPQNMGGQWIYMTNPQQVFGGSQYQFQPMQYQATQQQGMQNFQLPQQSGFSFGNEYLPTQQTSSSFPVGNLGQSQGFNPMMVNFSSPSLFM